MPWWYTLDIGEKNMSQNKKAPSHFNQFYLTKGNEKMYALNELPLDFNSLYAPPGHSVFFLKASENEFDYTNLLDKKNKSQGGDSGLFYGNKGYFSTDSPKNNLSSNLDELEEAMYDDKQFFEKYKNVIMILGVRYFIIRNDIEPLFSKNSNSFNLENINNKINKSSIFESISKEDFVTIAKIKNFLPHFYTSRNIINSKRAIDYLAKIISNPDMEIRSAVFFENQNKGKEDAILKQTQDNNRKSFPVLEFKKINPTKYRVRVHQASGKFPVVFSESFHNGWKAYAAQIQNSKFKIKNDLDIYEILDGNEEDQASKIELNYYIDKGWVSDLGDGKEKTTKHNKWENNKEKLDYVEKYNIDFISKNFQGTIQNDNLSNGNIFETWFKKPLAEENHLMANGYANSWVIDTDKICAPSSSQPSPRAGEGESFCVKNADGTYDMELIVEFWPQRLFYIGMGISGFTLFGCLVYLVYDWRRRRKNKIC